MSADLLAAFGNENPVQNVSASSPSATNHTHQPETSVERNDTWQPWPKAPQLTVKPDQGQLWRSTMGIRLYLHAFQRLGFTLS